MAEVTNDYAIGGDYGRSNHGAGLAAGAKAYADVAAENSADARAENPQNHLISAFGNNAGHFYLGNKIFDTDRDVLRGNADIRVEAKDNTQRVLDAIANSNQLNAEREARELRDRIAAMQAAQAAVASNAAAQTAATLAQLVGVVGNMNTVLTTLSNSVTTGDIAISL